MKKILIIVGECIFMIIVLLVIRIILGNCIPWINDSNVVSFVMYFISGMGSVLIYRLNTKKKQ